MMAVFSANRARKPLLSETILKNNQYSYILWNNPFDDVSKANDWSDAPPVLSQSSTTKSKEEP
jgi:hypothetical protein